MSRNYLRTVALVFAIIFVLFLGGCVSQDDFNSLKQRVGDLETRIQALEKKLGQKLEGKDTAKLEKKIASLEKRIAELEKKIASLSSNKATQQEEVAEEPQMEEPPLDEEVQPKDIAFLPEDQREIINELVSRGIIKLDNSGKFYPEKPVKLGELIDWIARIKGYKAENLKRRLAKAGLKLDFNREVTREELITVLLLASDYRKDVQKLTPEKVKKILSSDRSHLDWGQPLYPDYNKVSKWALKYVAFAIEKGFYGKVFGVKRIFMEEKSKRPRLEPKKKVTRREAAIALKLILEGK